jgi:hypothetical protein
MGELLGVTDDGGAMNDLSVNGALVPVPDLVPDLMPATAPLPWDLRMVGERLALMAETVDWDLPAAHGQPLQGEPLRDWCVQRQDRVAQHLTELGLGLWLAKREMGQGGFLGWLAEAGIPQRTANDAIQLARLLIGAVAAAVPLLTQLPRRKLQALAVGGQQLIEALTQDGTLAEVSEMTREEIRSLVAERLETARLRERVDALTETLHDAQETTRRLAALPTASRRLSALRLAMLEEIERLRSTALAMQRITTELIHHPADLDELGYDEACHATVYGLQGLQALVDRGINDAYALQQHYTPGERVPAPLMSADEERRVRDWAAQFLADADLRHAARVAAASVEAGPPPRANRRGRR